MQPSRIRNKRWNAEEEWGGDDDRQRDLKSLAYWNRYAGSMFWMVCWLEIRWLDEILV